MAHTDKNLQIPRKKPKNSILVMLWGWAGPGGFAPNMFVAPEQIIHQG
jgi:hypothetical protein